MDCEQLDCGALKIKPSTYRELYLRAYAAFAQEEGKYQRLLFLTRKIADAVPVGHEVLEEWKDWEQQIEESEIETCNE